MTQFHPHYVPRLESNLTFKQADQTVLKNSNGVTRYVFQQIAHNALDWAFLTKKFCKEIGLTVTQVRKAFRELSDLGLMEMIKGGVNKGAAWYRAKLADDKYSSDRPPKKATSLKQADNSILIKPKTNNINNKNNNPPNPPKALEPPKTKKRNQGKTVQTSETAQARQAVITDCFNSIHERYPHRAGSEIPMSKNREAFDKLCVGVLPEKIPALTTQILDRIDYLCLTDDHYANAGQYVVNLHRFLSERRHENPIASQPEFVKTGSQGFTGAPRSTRDITIAEHVNDRSWAEPEAPAAYYPPITELKLVE